MTAHDIPPIEAVLNGVATALITAGFIFIMKKDMKRHRAASALFLVFYVIYHALTLGHERHFGGTGGIRTLYFVILLTHIPLAGLIAYLVPRTFIFALKGNLERHKAWAKWTFPIWYYVSVTGVLVYFFVYVWWPDAG